MEDQTMTGCSECGGRNGGHEFNCAFSTYDASEGAQVRESRWIATFVSSREIHFALGPSVTEEFARNYAAGRLVATFNAYADGDVIAVRRER